MFVFVTIRDMVLPVRTDPECEWLYFSDALTVSPQHLPVFDRDRIQEIMSTSLMLVTALNPKIGYDNASKVLPLQWLRAGSSGANHTWNVGRMASIS